MIKCRVQILPFSLFVIHTMYGIFHDYIMRDGIILLVLPDLKLADILMLRKPHPCGGNAWKVVRLGADIGLECGKCSRQVLLPRRELARRFKKYIARGPDEPTND
jgi:hypothetical protein